MTLKIFSMALKIGLNLPKIALKTLNFSLKRCWQPCIVLRKVFSKQFCFIRCRRQHLCAVEQRRCSRFTFAENTISNSSKVTRAKFLGSNILFYFISICKFGSFKNPFATIFSSFELYFRIRRFILLVQTKKSDFYELWQKHKQLKTMEISEA